jgi:hypothetical protein
MTPTIAGVRLSPATPPTQARQGISQPPCHPRCPCLHGQPHLLASPTYCQPTYLCPTLDRRMQHPQRRHSSPSGRLQRLHGAIRPSTGGCNALRHSSPIKRMQHLQRANHPPMEGCSTRPVAIPLPSSHHHLAKAQTAKWARQGCLVPQPLGAAIRVWIDLDRCFPGSLSTDNIA